MFKAQEEVLDKVQALRLARRLLQKGQSDIAAIAVDNPALLRDWIDELRMWRQQSQRDLDLFDAAIDDLSAAQRGVAPHRAAA